MAASGLEIIDSYWSITLSALLYFGYFMDLRVNDVTHSLFTYCSWQLFLDLTHLKSKKNLMQIGLLSLYYICTPLPAQWVSVCLKCFLDILSNAIPMQSKWYRIKNKVSQAVPRVTFEEVDAPQSSLLSAEVKSVVAHVLITWCQCLSWTGAGRCYHPEENGGGGRQHTGSKEWTK